MGGAGPAQLSQLVHPSQVWPTDLELRIQRGQKRASPSLPAAQSPGDHQTQGDGTHMTRPASSGHWGLPGDATSELRPEGSLGGGQRGRELKGLRAAADTAGSFSLTCPGSTGNCNTHSHTHTHTQDEGPSLDSRNAKDLTQPPRQSLALPPHHPPWRHSHPAYVPGGHPEQPRPSVMSQPPKAFIGYTGEAPSRASSLEPVTGRDAPLELQAQAAACRIQGQPTSLFGLLRALGRDK